MVFGIYGIVVWWWPFVWHLILACLGPIIFFSGIILFTVGFSTHKETKSEVSDMEEEKKEDETKTE